MPLTSWWFIGLGVLACSAAALSGFFFGARRPLKPLPLDWRLDARPVLNADERQAMRILREALPHNVVLAKLPLVRLCQPRDNKQMRDWFDLLDAAYVSFAICAANGRVLAVIDLDTGRATSARVNRIKQGVLEACRIRYVRCRADNFPPAGDLALLLRPQGSIPRPAPIAPAAAPQPSSFQHARGTLSDTVKLRRAQRFERAPDSRFAQDSFFAPASQLETAANSDFPATATEASPPTEQSARR